MTSLAFNVDQITLVCILNIEKFIFLCSHFANSEFLPNVCNASFSIFDGLAECRNRLVTSEATCNRPKAMHTQVQVIKLKSAIFANCR